MRSAEIQARYLRHGNTIGVDFMLKTIGKRIKVSLSNYLKSLWANMTACAEARYQNAWNNDKTTGFWHNMYHLVVSLHKYSVCLCRGVQKKKQLPDMEVPSDRHYPPQFT